MKQFEISTLGIKFKPMEEDEATTSFNEDEVTCICRSTIRGFIRIDMDKPGYGFHSAKLTSGSESLGLPENAAEWTTSFGNGWARDLTIIFPQELDGFEGVLLNAVHLFNQRLIASADKIRAHEKNAPENAVYLTRVNKIMRGIDLPETHRRLFYLTIEDKTYDVEMEIGGKVNDRVMFVDDESQTWSVFATNTGLFYWNLDTNDRMNLELGKCTSMAYAPEGILAVIDGDLHLVKGTEDGIKIVTLPHLNKEICRVLYSGNIIAIHLIDDSVLFKALHQLFATNMWRKANNVQEALPIDEGKHIKLIGAFGDNAILGHGIDKSGGLRVRVFATPKIQAPTSTPAK